MRIPSSVIVSCFLASLPLGCGELPEEERLDRPRVLAVMAEAADPGEPFNDANSLLSATSNEFVPGGRGRVSMLAADGEGRVDEGRVDVAWVACLLDAGEYALSCFRDGLREHPQPAACTEVDAGIGADDVAQVCDLGMASDGTFEVPWLWSAASARTLMLASIVGLDRDAEGCVEALGSAAVDLPDDCGFVTHALPYAPYKVVAPYLREAGISEALLDELKASQPSSQARGLNPVIDRVELMAIGADAAPRAQDASQPVLLAAEDALEIVVGFPEDAVQSYERRVFGEGYRRVEERLDTRWYATAGSFRNVEEDPLESRAQWSLGDETANGPVTIFAVVRDGRWGTRWLRWSVVVEGDT